MKKYKYPNYRVVEVVNTFINSVNKKVYTISSIYIQKKITFLGITLGWKYFTKRPYTGSNYMRFDSYEKAEKFIEEISKNEHLLGEYKSFFYI